VHARPQSLRKSWTSRFGGQLAIAAVMVLTVSITMVLVNEQPELAPPPVQKALAPRAVAPAAQKELRAAEPGPAPALEKRRSDAPGMSQGRIATDSLKRAAPAAPASVQQTQEISAPTVSGSLAARREPMPFSADAGTASEAKLEAPAQRAPAKDLADRAAMQIAPMTTAVMPAPVAPAAAPPAPAAMANAAPAKTVMAFPASPAASNAPAEAERSRADAITEQPQAFARKKQDSANLLGLTEKAAGSITEAPAQWLKRIIDLRKEGKTKEADEELAKFRKRYPDYPLPAELKSEH
jgi:hypothetical protein